MKHFFSLKALIMGAFLVAVLQLQAQEANRNEATPEEAFTVHNYAPWEVGLFAGAANAYGDLVDTRFIQFNRTNLAYGGFIRYNASRNLSIRASYLRGKLEGSDMDSEELSQRGLSFESTINEIALVGQWDFWGHKRYDDRGGFSRTISPYAFAGFGVGMTDLTTDYSSVMGDPAMEEKAARDQQNTQSTQVAFPLGVGVNMDLSERLLFSFEFGFRPVFNDYLDGVSAVGNPNRNDWYSMAGASMAYRMTGQDKDRDGFPDHEDECPRIPGSKATNGCADSDGDGILDAVDECPTVAGVAQFNGCRDTDGDGLPDSKDRCPYEKGPADADGCPPPARS
jgi:opacity protein-like surface antigen